MLVYIRTSPSRLLATYVLVAVAWLLGVAYLLHAILDDPAVVLQLELASATVFIAFNAAFLYLYLFPVYRDRQVRHATGATEPLQAGGRKRLILLIGILYLAVPLLMIVVGSVQYPWLKRDALKELSEIADLKRQQIESWITERSADANTLTNDPGFSRLVQDHIENPDDETLSLLLPRMEAFREAYGYNAVVITDSSGRTVLHVGLDDEWQKHTRITERQHTLNRFYLHANDVNLHYHTSGPLIPATIGEPSPGNLLLDIEPDNFIYPYLSRWPTASKTGETLLATRSNGKVLFLTPLRHQRGNPGTLTHTLSDPDLPAAVALRGGGAGRFEGRDYRGVPVLSVYRPIRNTDWQLIAKLDRAEVLEPLYPMVAWVGTIALLAATLVSFQLLLLWRKQQQLQALAIKAEKRRANKLLQQFFDLPFVGMAITSPNSKHWLRYNDRLCSMFGYSREELGRKTWAELTHPDDLEKDVSEFNRVMQGSSEGYSMDKRFFRKDGTVIDAYIDVKCVRAPDGTVDHFVAMVQDITERKQEERRHTELYRLLDFAIQSLPIPVLITSVPDLKITHINEAAKALMDRRTDEVENIPLRQCRDYWPAFYPDGSPFPVEDMPLFRAIEHGETCDGMEMILRKGDEDHWVFTSAAPLSDESGAVTAAIVAFPEITGLKESLAELDRARARAQHYLDVAAVMMISLDNEGRIRLVNRTACEILGYEEEELLMQDWFEMCLPPRDRDEVRKVFRHLIVGNVEPFRHVENFVFTRDGTERTVSWHNTVLRDEDGMISGILTSGSDVTEQRNAEAERAASEARLKTLVNTIPDLVWLKDTEGVYLACNPAFERFAGRQEADILGSTDYDLVDAETADCFRVHDRKAMEAGRPSSNEETLTFATDGYRGVFETVKTPMYDTGGRLIGVLGVARDITERKQDQARIERLTWLYATLSETNQAIVRIDDEQALMEAICRNAVEHAGFRMAWIGMIDEATQRVVPVASAGDDSGYLDGIEISIDPESPLSAGPVGTAIREAGPCWRTDFLQNPDNSPWHQRAREAGYHAVAALPVHRGGRIVGTFVLYAGETDAFDKDAQKLLVEMAHDISFALDNFQREEERRFADERLSLVIKGSRDAPWDWDLVNDRLWYSPQFWEMLGEEINEYPEDPGTWKRYVHPDDIPQIEAAIERVMQPGHEWESVETRTRHRDGHYIPTLLRGFASRDEDGNVVRLTGTVMDLTEQKRVEQQLRAQRNQIERARKILDTHLENSPLGVIEWDTEFRVKRWSSQAEVMFHWSEEDVLHKRPDEWRFVHDADRDRVQDIMAELTSDKKARNHIINRNYTREGEIRHIEWYNSALYDEHGNLISILSLLHDVTEQHQAQEELRRRESLLNQIFDILPVGLWIADADGRLIRGNPAGVAIWGAEPHVSPDEYDMFKARRLPSGEPVEADDWALSHTVREGVTVSDELLEIDAFDGRTRTILNYAAPVKNDEGAIEGAVVVNLDITDRQQVQQHMEEQLDELNRWYETTIGREERVLELKREINDLLRQRQQPLRYPSVESTADKYGQMKNNHHNGENMEDEPK